MDEEEIDQLYEEEKQKALDDYQIALKDMKNRAQAEKEFRERNANIMKKYDQLMTERLQNKNKKSKIKDLIQNLSSKLNFFRRK